MRPQNEHCLDCPASYLSQRMDK